MGAPRRRVRFEAVSFVGLFLLAGCAYWPVEVGGRLGAVLYREPKLAVLQVLVALFVLCRLWAFPGSLLAAGRLGAWNEAPVFPLLLFVAWSAATGMWAQVLPNWWFELSQLLLATAFLLALRSWAAACPKVLDLAVGAVVSTLALATMIGLAQGVGLSLPGLLPVSPEIGVLHPSVMGYKNPMALALVAQIHLVAWLLYRSDTPGSRLATPVQRTGLALLLGVEILYLATLQSRASYLALAATAPFALFIFLRRASRRGHGGRAGLAVLVLTVGVAGLALLPGTRERLGTLQDLGRGELGALEGDRVTYLLNTLGMVRAHPFGVGLGNWQVQYPVFRAHNRAVAFTEEVQVRRAHDDYAQILGETGWTGLGLWLLVLLGAIVCCLVSARPDAGDQRRRMFHAFLAIQLGAIAIASAGDYFLDLPFHRILLFLLLALVAVPPSAQEGERRAGRRTGDLLLRAALSAGLLFLAIAGAVLFVKSDAAIRLQVSWNLVAADGPEALEGIARDREALAKAFQEPGRRFLSLPGHEKTFHRTVLLLAWVAELAGDRELATHLAARSLRLHPHSPNSLGFLATISRSEDRSSAARYTEAWDYVLHQATRGYRRPYPELPPPRSNARLRESWDRMFDELERRHPRRVSESDGALRNHRLPCRSPALEAAPRISASPFATGGTPGRTGRCPSSASSA